MVFKVIKLINFFRELENYTGAQAEIKKSIENPNSSEIKEHAWSTLLPLVAKLKKFWKFSINLSQSYTALIRELTSDDDNATKQLEQKQALARQLADLLHFTLQFDRRKMENAQLQNDYSFFRYFSSLNFYFTTLDI